MPLPSFVRAVGSRDGNGTARTWHGEAASASGQPTEALPVPDEAPVPPPARPRPADVKSMRNKNMPRRRSNGAEVRVDLPAEWKDGKIIETLDMSVVPTERHLSNWLTDRGHDVSDWGNGNTKSVKKLWLELKDSESGLELWEKSSGERQIVRVTHVLRAKVCSPESYKREIFLFNTWQQFGDGRRRVRNGLLSEKLTISEMPLERNLHEVCTRAVTEEEMQRVAEALFTITPGAPPPPYDPNYKCPITVVDEYFCEHVVEVEASKSYPRLVTMYHLYTVDIVCNGLPSVDFTTLEYDHPDEKGFRKLKYVHAWVWKEWSEVQRYLFEGSVMKQQKVKGSFATADELDSWLGSFNLDLEQWGVKGMKTVGDLWGELEAEEAHLEMWGRNDGAPLLMRVVHVLQLKVSSPDPRLKGKFLYNTWIQTGDGTEKSVNRLMATKLSTGKLPFDADRFSKESRCAVSTLMKYVVDSFFRLDKENPPKVSTLDQSKVSVHLAELVDHHVDVDLSPTFKGLCTLYHLYTVHTVVDGLPQGNFSSVEVRNDEVRNVMGWCWVTWPQVLDMVHSRQRDMEETLNIGKDSLSLKSSCVNNSLTAVEQLQSVLGQLKETTSPAAAKHLQAMEELAGDLSRGYQDMRTGMEHARHKSVMASVKRSVPPSIVSELAEKAMVAKDSITTKEI